MCHTFTTYKVLEKLEDQIVAFIGNQKKSTDN